MTILYFTGRLTTIGEARDIMEHCEISRASEVQQKEQLDTDRDSEG